MEKIKIYIRVEGEDKRHIFRVPSGITLETLLDKFAGQIGIKKEQIGNLRAAVFTSLGQPLDRFEISDEAEILILKNPLADDASYEGVES